MEHEISGAGLSDPTLWRPSSPTDILCACSMISAQRVSFHLENVRKQFMAITRRFRRPNESVVALRDGQVLDRAFRRSISSAVWTDWKARPRCATSMSTVPDETHPYPIPAFLFLDCIHRGEEITVYGDGD